MKMEVLSVQSQFQGQFVIGSAKVKDWTSPLTSSLPPHHRQHHHHRNHHQNNRHHHSNSHYSSNNVKTAAASETTTVSANNQDVDVVDGFTPRVDGHYHHGPHTTKKQQQQQQQQPHEQYYNHYHHNQAMPTALATSAAAAAATLAKSSSGKNSNTNSNNFDDDDTVVDVSTNIDYQTSSSPPHYNISRYNSNLICCGGNITGVDVDIDAAAIDELSMRLQSELRAAKSRHLACTEVSLPWDLTPRIAAEIIRLSEKEPCGIRGCTIYIEFEDEPSNTRRIASLKIDPNTVSTFELYLTLKHDKSGWTSLLPQFIKNLTRSSSIIISPDFSLTKNKLYHSSSE